MAPNAIYNVYLRLSTQRRKQRLHEKIAAFARAEAGTELDLDEELEQTGIAAIQGEQAR